MSGMAEVETQLHLIIKDLRNAADKRMMVCSSADRAQIVDAILAAGFGPVKEEKRLMQLAALMAYDAVEDNVKREAAAKALEDAAAAIEPRMMQFFKVTQDLNDQQRAWLRARAAAVRGEG